MVATGRLAGPGLSQWLWFVSKIGAILGLFLYEGEESQSNFHFRSVVQSS